MSESKEGSKPQPADIEVGDLVKRYLDGCAPLYRLGIVTWAASADTMVGGRWRHAYTIQLIDQAGLKTGPVYVHDDNVCKVGE